MLVCRCRQTAVDSNRRAECAVKRLNGMDALLLYSETPNLHTHTLKVAVVDAADYPGEFNYELFRRTFGERLPLLDPLRYLLVDIPWRLHHPMWLENCDVDLDYHLRRVRRTGSRRAAGARRGHRPGRQHPAGPAPSAMGVLLRRRHGRSEVRSHRQGPSCIGRRGGIGESACQRDGSEAKSARSRHRAPAIACRPRRAELLRAARRDHAQQVAALPGVFKDAASGFWRMRRRSRQRVEQPDLAGPCRRRRHSSTTWCRRREDLRPRHSPSPR